MTQNFLKNKQRDRKYKKSQIPADELHKKQVQDQCTDQMTSIMKKMN